MNLDDLDEVPMPATPAPGRGAPPRAPAKLGSRNFGDDDGNEKTNAINLADVNLDDLDEAPISRPQPAAPMRPTPGRPAPAPRSAAPPARPQPGRPAPRAPAPIVDDEKTSAVSLDDVERALREPAPLPPKRGAAPADTGEEKTSALNLDEIDLDALDAMPMKKPPPRAPARSSVPPVQSQPRAVSLPPKKPAAPPVVEKTMAVSLEEFEAHKPQLGSKLKHEPPAADRTYLVDDEEEVAPVVKAPPPKKPSVLGRGSEGPSAPAREVEPQLVVRGGPDVGKSFKLTKDLTLVGRGLDADVVINDASASRKHFNIVRTLSGWKMVDLGSGNGTKIDGTRVTEIAMQHGMRIEAGGTTLEWIHEDVGAGSGAPASDMADVDLAPVGRAPTGMAAAMSEEVKPSRRLQQEDKPAERKRDAARLDKFDDKDEGAGKSRGAPLPPPSDEKTSFGDIQALEIDPEWEARRLKQRREGVADSPEDASDEESGGKRGGGVGKKIAIVGAIVAVLGGGFVAADKFAGLGIIFPKEVKVTTPQPEKDKPDKDPEDKVADKDPEDKVADKDPEDKPKDPEDKPATVDGNPKEAAKAKVAEAVLAEKEQRWFAARDLYRAALKLDDLVDGGDAGLVTVDNQITALANFMTSIKAMHTRDWADAIAGFEKIKEGSAPYERAQLLLEIAKEAAVVEHLRAASKLYASKDLPGAKKAITEALKYSGEYAEGAAFRDAIDRAAAPDADLTELDPSDPNAKNPPKAQPSDLKPGLAAYAKGDFPAVANAFDAIVYGGTASRVDVATAKAWSVAATVYDEAMKQIAANVGKPEEQLGYMRSARRADAILGDVQGKAITTELGKLWGALAKKSLDAKDPAQAGFFARLGLSFDPAAVEAKAVQDEALKAAKAWVAEAKGLTDSPDKVVDLYVQALKALPPDDPDFAAAETALAALLKPAE